jgi:hypothetical protein
MTTMNDSSGHQRGRVPAGYPQQANGQPPEADAPDFMQLAAQQVRRAMEGIDKLATQFGADHADVIKGRLDIADRLTALAEIQYAIPDDGGDPGDEEEGEGGYPRR